MSSENVVISLPLDPDGFLRRECTSCERQFKWWHTVPHDDVPLNELFEQVEAYFCPYCQQPAPSNAWWTREQLEYAQQVAWAEFVAPSLRQFKRKAEQTNRKTKGFFKIDVTLPDLSKPAPLLEQDDMVLVEFPCHPEEPVKVDASWTDEVTCILCGIHYPIEIVQILPSESEE